MRLYIVRHGNTFDTGDVVTRVGGRTDLSLSISGQEQAKALSEAFANMPLDVCYASPLKRTLETAKAICASRDINIETAEFLKEIDYGPDENKAETEVVERLGQQAILDWDTYSKVPDGWNVDPMHYIKAWGDFITKLESENTLIVTSHGVARFLLDCLDINVSQRKLPTGSVACLEKAGAQWTAHYWGLRPPLPQIIRL